LTYNACENVLEIGPGKGALTQLLAQEKHLKLKAVEADRDMVDYLTRNNILGAPQIINDDFLKLPLDRVFDQEQFSVIGNFPYNISSQICFKKKWQRELFLRKALRPTEFSVSSSKLIISPNFSLMLVQGPLGQFRKLRRLCL